MNHIDLSAVGAVCKDCAQMLGFTLKDKAAFGVWVGECGICHQRKHCTDLHNDWNPPCHREKCPNFKHESEATDGK